MKKLLIFLIFFIINLTLNASTYYIRTGGNDAANGLTDATAWESLSKVNGFSFSFGDHILFNCGDTWYGTLAIPRGNIIIGAYGTGDNPIITGFTILSGWTDEGAGIYSTTVTSETLTNMVLINGVQYGMGRYPHDTWLTYTSHNTDISITDTLLNGTPDWMGAEVVIKKNGFTIDRCLITCHTKNTLTYITLGIKYDFEPIVNGSGYFIQNDIRCLTNYGDWYHDTANGRFYMYFGSVDPTILTVKMATLNYVVFNASGYDYVIIDGLDITGSISSAMEYEHDCNYCQIKYCNISFAGDYGIRYQGSYGLIDNNYVANCNETGVNESYGAYAEITNNVIRDIGLIRGSAYNANSSNGIKFEDATGILIQYNRIENIAYCGVMCSGYDVPHIVKNNFINHCCLWPEMDDGGGIYTSTAMSEVRTIEGNIVLNVGYDNTQSNSFGIYLDLYPSYTLVKNNTIAFCGGGIFLAKASYNTIEGNTVYDNYGQLMFSDRTGTLQIHDNIIHDNIFIAKAGDQFALIYNNISDDIPSFGTAYDNYYARPIDDNATFFISPSTYETLAQWQTRVSPQDASSLKSNVTTTDTTGFFKFIYNASVTNKVIPLDVPMIDIKGKKYCNSVTLLPYTSSVLMVDPNPVFSILRRDKNGKLIRDSNGKLIRNFIK